MLLIYIYIYNIYIYIYFAIDYNRVHALSSSKVKVFCSAPLTVTVKTYLGLGGIDIGLAPDVNVALKAVVRFTNMICSVGYLPVDRACNGLLFIKVLDK